MPDWVLGAVRMRCDLGDIEGRMVKLKFERAFVKKLIIRPNSGIQALLVRFSGLCFMNSRDNVDC